MCPSGTLRYIKKIEDIALDLTEVVEKEKRAQNINDKIHQTRFIEKIMISGDGGEKG